MWQLKVKEIKEAWETKKLGFVRILNERKIAFGKLLKIVSYWKLCQKDFIFQGLLARTFGEIWICGGWTRTESICLFCCCLFCCECGGLAQSFECRLLHPRRGCTEELGALAEVLVGLLHQSYKGLETAKCLVGLILSATGQPIYKRSVLWPESSPVMTREEFSPLAAALAW